MACSHSTKAAGLERSNTGYCNGNVEKCGKLDLKVCLFLKQEVFVKVNHANMFY
jgi:hypothetical protein